MGQLEKIKVAVIGGGTGSVSILNGLKKYSNIDLSVIVSMTDDGGSNQVVRDEFGLLPLSDLRKSIIALAKDGDGVLRKLFTYRFDKGSGLLGHTLGNLIMMALSNITGSEEQAVKEAAKIFNVIGNVYPVTYDNAKLIAKYSNGEVVVGEHFIDEPENFDLDTKIIDFKTDITAKANPKAISAILEADYIILGPGDLYTSILANVVIDGIVDAITQSNAKTILVTNLMTKKGQTHWMTGKDFVAEVEKYINKNIDYVLVNNKQIPHQILLKYKNSNESQIENNYNNSKNTIIEADLIGGDEIKKSSGDTLMRSLIRHDSNKLGHILYKLINT